MGFGANWANTTGTSELAAVWTDPNFGSPEKAFYYARVLEIPTPRWSRLIVDPGPVEIS
jgi:hypothetical protein